jgi:hypothetical protein
MTKDVTAEDISTHNNTDVALSPEDIIVHNMKINYGSKAGPAPPLQPSPVLMARCFIRSSLPFPCAPLFVVSLQDKNPVDNTQFYRDSSCSSSFFIPKQRVSYILPEMVPHRSVFLLPS